MTGTERLFYVLGSADEKEGSGELSIASLQINDTAFGRGGGIINILILIRCIT